MYRVSDEKFNLLVEEGIALIPERFLKKLNNVAVISAPHQTPNQRQARKLKPNDLLLGLYEGVPQTERWGYNLAMPDKITIFQEPIETLAGSEDDIKKLVHDTVWHELAHHFGMNEGRVRAAEKKRHK